MQRSKSWLRSVRILLITVNHFYPRLVPLVANVRSFALGLMCKDISGLKHDAACFRPSRILQFKACIPARASDILPALEAEPSSSQPLNKILSAPSASSGGHCEIEASYGVLDREDTFIGQTASLPLERDHLAAFHRSASQRLTQLQEELHFVHFENIRKLQVPICKQQKSGFWELKKTVLWIFFLSWTERVHRTESASNGRISS